MSMVSSKLSLSSSMSGTKLGSNNSTGISPSPCVGAGPLRIEAIEKIQRRLVCASSNETIAVEVTRIAPHSKYLKHIKSTKKYHTHDPDNKCNVEDIVTLTKCKLMSKTKTFIVVERKVGPPCGERLVALRLPPLESESSPAA